MDKITIDGKKYSLDKKTLKTSQKKLKVLKSKNGVPALAVYIAVIFLVFGLWVLFYQVTMWFKTNEWQNLPWYQTIFKTEPSFFQYLASVSLSLMFIVMTPVSYYLLKILLPTDSLRKSILHLEKVVNKLSSGIK